MALPQLTDEQRKQALEGCCRVTPALSFASRSKGEVPRGPCSAPMTPSLPHEGSTLIRVSSWLWQGQGRQDRGGLGISTTRRVQGLGVRQREQLLEQLTK